MYEFLALSRYGDENFVVFVEGGLPDEILKVKIKSVNKSYAKADIIEIIKPSEYRIKPLCAIYNACGSCQAQIAPYDYIVEQKDAILKDIFCDIETKPFIKSPKITCYRHKIQYPCRQTKNSKRVKIGYFKKNSHDLTDVKFCPMIPDVINKITACIRENYKGTCYSEITHSGNLRNILFRISTLGEIILTFVLNQNKKDKYIVDFSNELMLKFPQIKGVFANFNQNKTNKILSNNNEKIKGCDYIIEKIGNKKYKIGSTNFFQVNPYVLENFFDVIKNNIKTNSKILDAYGGVGTIGIYLSDSAKSITLVEENNEAVKLAKENYELNNIKNYEIYKGNAKEHFLNFKKKNVFFDYTILDPPRKGCDREGLKDIATISKNIFYVSCNPQTLKRDMKYLIEKGFEPKFIQGGDLFPYTYHIETIIYFENPLYR